MGQDLSERFGRWVGSWRGKLKPPDRPMARLEIDIQLLLGGTLLDIQARSYTTEDQYLFGGVTLAAAGPEGLLQCVNYATSAGVMSLTETPEDADTLLLSGPFAAGKHYHIVLALEGERLRASSGVSAEGKLPPPEARLMAVLSRLTPATRVFVKREPA